MIFLKDPKKHDPKRRAVLTWQSPCLEPDGYEKEQRVKSVLRWRWGDALDSDNLDWPGDDCGGF